MAHPLGPPTALLPDPIVRRDQRIRLTARVVGRMLLLPPADQPPPAEVGPEQESARGAPSRR
jgi:hypothetical protein